MDKQKILWLFDVYEAGNAIYHLLVTDVTQHELNFQIQRAAV
jgi:hypothetical protein